VNAKVEHPDVAHAILVAAGFVVRAHRDGASWIATSIDSGQQVEADTPAAVALKAVKLLRQQRNDLAEL